MMLTKENFFSLIFITLFLGIRGINLSAQEPIYSFQQVDTLPTFQDCSSNSKLEVDTWINCFYPKIEKLVSDSISSMEKQLGMEFSGIIKVQFVIDSNGAIGNTEISNKPHPILKKGAKDVLNSIKGLKPAKYNGQSVSMSLTMEVNYNLVEMETASLSNVDTIYKVQGKKATKLDRIPHLPLCNTKLTKKEQLLCTFQELYSRYSLIHGYPPIARETGIEGTVLISLIIEPDGFISKVKLEKDIGGGCGQAVLAALQMETINRSKWIPALKDGKPVRSIVYYPQIFRLEEKK